MVQTNHLLGDGPVNALVFLIIFPLFIAGLALVLPLGNALRRIIGVVATVVLSAVSIYLLVTYLDTGPVYFKAELLV
jgi:ech hydrogenase subunit A